MKVNSNIDERNDPLVSTRAAARLMRNNYGRLHSWPLTVTAWNHGPSGVRNVVEKFGTDDIAKIVNGYSSRTFGFASQNFYACFLAVLEVEAKATTYFSRPVWQDPLKFTEFKTPGPFIKWRQILKVFSDNDALAQDFNPQITAHARSSKLGIPAGTKIRIPREAAELAGTLFSGKKKATPRAERPAAPAAATSSPSDPPETDPQTDTSETLPAAD